MEEKEIKTRTAKIWLGDDGIIRATALPITEQTLVDAEADVAAIVKVGQGKRRPVLADIRKIKSTSRAGRQLYSKDETAKIVSAVAFIIGSPISKVIGSLFLGLSRLPVPVKLFTLEAEAIEWLKGFLENEK